MHQHTIKFFKDSRFYIPILLLVLVEIILQTGIYDSIQKPNSSARQVREIGNKIKSKTNQPDIIFLGTSVAYEGIILSVLNDKLAMNNIYSQSIACQSADLIIQHLLYKESRSVDTIRYVIHILDPLLSIKSSNEIDQVNLNMISQFPKVDVIKIFDDYSYEKSLYINSFILFRSISYKSDMRDAVLNPFGRIKELGRYSRRPISNYFHTNSYDYKLSNYTGSNVENCIHSASVGIGRDIKGNYFDESGQLISDTFHRNSVLSSCNLVKEHMQDKERLSDHQELFFKRLQELYKNIKEDNRKIIVIIPPYSSIGRELNSEEIISPVKNFLIKTAEQQPLEFFDLRHIESIDQDTDNFYDILHLNRVGAEKFTLAVYPILQKLK